MTKILGVDLITEKSVDFSKMSDIPPSTFIGRSTDTSGSPEAFSIDTAKTMLGISSESGNNVSTDDVISLIMALGG